MKVNENKVKEILENILDELSSARSNSFEEWSTEITRNKIDSSKARIESLLKLIEWE